MMGTGGNVLSTLSFRALPGRSSEAVVMAGVEGTCLSGVCDKHFSMAG